jgi:hypothetical protein
MEDPEAKGGKLPLHPKTQQEDEAAASIDDAGDQYHLAGPQSNQNQNVCRDSP